MKLIIYPCLYLKLQYSYKLAVELFFYECFLFWIEYFPESIQEIIPIHMFLDKIKKIYEVFFQVFSSSFLYHCLIDGKHIAEEKIRIIEITIHDHTTISKCYQLVGEESRTILNKHLNSKKIDDLIVILIPYSRIYLYFDIHICFPITQKEEKSISLFYLFFDFSIFYENGLNMYEKEILIFHVPNEINIKIRRKTI